MDRMRTIETRMWLGILAAGVSVFLVANAFAHCDSTGGPLIPEAKAALEKGDVTAVLSAGDHHAEGGLSGDEHRE